MPKNNLYTCSQDSIKHIIDHVKELESQSRGGGFVHAAHARAAVPGCDSPGRSESVSVRDGEHPQSVFVGASGRLGWRDGEGEGAGAHGGGARGCNSNRCRPRKCRSTHAALIIGGGAAGMNAALSLAEQGFPVHLIEKSDQLGGNLRNLHYLDRRGTRSPQDYLRN